MLYETMRQEGLVLFCPSALTLRRDTQIFNARCACLKIWCDQGESNPHLRNHIPLYCHYTMAHVPPVGFEPTTF